ncbi:hypothetical protein G6F56_002384 [Rhizopus delemar]|nr:hypothetical protein G6F56_002384 [Rhizopus delemar]
MKFQFATLLLLAVTFVSNVFATSSLSSELVSRHYKYPVQAGASLYAEVMAKIEAQVQAKVLAQISASFCEKVSAHLDVSTSLLNGVVSADVGVSAVEKLAINKLKVDVEADLKAKAKVYVYAKVEAYLKKQGGSKKLTQKQLLKILVQVEAKLKEYLKAELPTIGAHLKFRTNAQVNVALKKIAVNIPHLAEASVKANFDAKAAVSASVAVGVKVSAKLNATQAAKAILKAL